MELALDEQDSKRAASLEARPADHQVPDSFDSLLRAAVDVSDVPLSDPLTLKVLSEGATLGGGRFEISRMIGRGGMGAVYEAEDRDTRARVALKVLNRVEPNAIKRFKDEFRILADTIHPHLVRLRDLLMEGGVWFFTMDLIEGTTLSAHLANVGGLWGAPSAKASSGVCCPSSSTASPPSTRPGISTGI